MILDEIEENIEYLEHELDKCSIAVGFVKENHSRSAKRIITIIETFIITAF